MSSIDYSIKAGLVLKKLIKENYHSQEEFAEDIGYEIRTVSRYVNQGIKKLSTAQDLAEFFGLDFISFLQIETDEEVNG